MGSEQARATFHGDVVGKKGSVRVQADSQKPAWGQRLSALLPLLPPPPGPRLLLTALGGGWPSISPGCRWDFGWRRPHGR